jgi:hypothetical protein
LTNFTEENLIFTYIYTVNVKYLSAYNTLFCAFNNFYSLFLKKNLLTYRIGKFKVKTPSSPIGYLSEPVCIDLFEMQIILLEVLLIHSPVVPNTRIVSLIIVIVYVYSSVFV